MSCSSGGTTTPGSRKLAWNASMFFVAASTSSWRARKKAPESVRETGHRSRSSTNVSYGTPPVASRGSVATDRACHLGSAHGILPAERLISPSRLLLRAQANTCGPIRVGDDERAVAPNGSAESGELARSVQLGDPFATASVGQQEGVEPLAPVGGVAREERRRTIDGARTEHRARVRRLPDRLRLVTRGADTGGGVELRGALGAAVPPDGDHSGNWSPLVLVRISAVQVAPTAVSFPVTYRCAPLQTPPLKQASSPAGVPSPTCTAQIGVMVSVRTT